jgi:hypothetical protein
MKKSHPGIRFRNMMPLKPGAVRYALILSCFIALLSVQRSGYVSPVVDAKSPEASMESTPLPASSICISGSLSPTDPTYKRPNFTLPCTVPATTPTVRYDVYEFEITGCASGSVTVSLCGPNAICAPVPGQNLDTIIWVYRQGGAPHPFNPGVPCSNLVAVNDDIACATSPLLSGLTTTLGPGRFVVVVSALSGTLQNNGNYSLFVDSSTCTVTQVDACQPITINPSVVPCGAKNTPYPDTTFTATGGTAPYSFSISGTLPAGLSFDATTGTISGTPTQAGGFPFTITATDANLCNNTRSYQIVISDVTLPCITDGLCADGPTFHPANTRDSDPTGIDHTGPGGTCRPALSTTEAFYNAYEFNLSSCSSTILTATLCGPGSCGPLTGAGALANPVIYLYRKPDGSAGAFDPANPCNNLVAANNDLDGIAASSGGLASCPASNELAAGLKRTIGSGSFVIVVTSFGNRQTGAYRLFIDTPGCSLDECATITGTVSGGGTICAGGSATVTVTLNGGTPPYTVTLNNGVGPLTGNSPLTFTVNPSVTTTYSVISATDSANCPATVSGSATVTVGDAQPPIISCQAGITVSANSNCQAGVPNVLGGVTVSDNCTPPGSLTLTQSPAAGTMVGLGAHTITVTVTDASNNSSQCTTTVTVVDNTPPTITLNGANPMVVECHGIFADPGATATDNCAGSVTVTASGSVNVNVPGTYTITYTATDGTNPATATRTVNVVDTTPPVIATCASNKSILADGNCQAAIPNLIGEVVAADSCSSATITQSPAAGTMVGAGNTVVTITATDAAGNFSVCTATVTVVDISPPTVTCPAGTTASADANCQAVVPDVTGGVTASDNCTPAGSLIITQVPPAGALVELGVTTITITAKDAADNSATCTTTFTVNDTTPPSITCPANITKNNDSNQCSAIATFQPVGSDNCTGVSTSCTPASGTAFPVGTTTVTCTATDAAGNHTSCSFTVTVNDVQPPNITCPANITRGTDPNAATAVVTFLPSVTDNCAGVTFNCSPASGSSFALGTTTVTCTATDAHSNTDTCSFTVTVVDTQPPTIICPANQIRSNSPNQCGAVVTYPAPTVTDNTPGSSFVCSPAAGSFFPIGTTMVTCVATDSGGNHSNCSFTVTVNDTQAPTIICPADITVVGNIPGQCSANVSLSNPTAADNCPGVIVTGVRSDGLPLGAPYPLGTAATPSTIITWTAKDASNNTVSCTQKVTVTNQNPVVTITGPATGSTYSVGTTVNFTGTFTDNAGGSHTATWTFDTISKVATVVEPSGSTPGSANTSFTFTTAGVYQVSLTVNDGCGGSGSANTIGGVSALVVVYDPDGAFVTGGGWFNSLAGAYPANPSATGKANFGINAKYHNNATIPTGQTEFNLNFANFNFHSSAYEWLVVTGAKAQYKGTGKVNGGGSYGFIVTVIDGKVSGGGGVDKFRIKIWDANNNNAVVYDNQMNAPDSANPTTSLGGGSIVIH